MERTPDTRAAARTLCLLMAFTLLGVGLQSDPPMAIWAGMGRILTSRAVLLSDYFILGGRGAAFLNAGLVMLMSIGLVELCGARYTGKTVAALFLMPGFALFGKHPLNILPFFLGVWLYSRYRREPFKDHLAAALYSTTLCPVVSELWCNAGLPLWLGIPLGVLAGGFIGFIMTPLANHVVRSHRGYILFNFGFASGFIAYLAMALVRAAGSTVQTLDYWATGVDREVLLYLLCLCALLILFGMWLSGWDIRKLKDIFKMTGCAPDNDAFTAVGVGLTMVNMGVVGLLSTGYILMIGGDLSGPVVGGVLTAIGFAASGVQPRNFLPVMAGVFLFSVWGAYPPVAPAVQLAALFGAVALAPVAGEYGMLAGVAAGMLHYALVTVTGAPTGGLNLYNNGFAAGIVAMLLVTVIDVFYPRERRQRRRLARSVLVKMEEPPAPVAQEVLMLHIDEED